MPLLNPAATSYMANSIGTGWGSATLTILGGATPLAVHVLTGFTEALGVLTANAIANTSMLATGTATSATLTQSGRTLTLSVGTSNAELVMPSLNYEAGRQSVISSLTITYPQS